MADRSYFIYPSQPLLRSGQARKPGFQCEFAGICPAGHICNLETAGKLSPEESYQQIRDLWEQLKRSEKQLRIGEDPFRSNEGPEAEGAGVTEGELHRLLPLSLLPQESTA